MQIDPIASSTAATSANAATTAAATSGTKTLGQDDFLKLLSVQMQSQDPLKPMEDTAFIAQMTSFTSLEQMKSLTTSMQSFVTQQRSVDAQAYLGKQVTLLDPSKGSISGTVTGINYADSQPQIVVNGKSYDPALISAISNPSTASTQ